MRTVDAGITADEIVAARHDTHTLTAKNELLSFAAFTTQTNADLDTAIPQTYSAGLAAFRYTNGKAYVKAMTASTAASWALTSADTIQLSGAGAAVEYRAMRYSIYANELLQIATHAGAEGSGIQIKSMYPPDDPAGNWGPAFGPAASDTSSNVTRVEAIISVSTGAIVAVGTHRFDLGFSTIQFWFVDNTTVTRLNTIIQMPLTETYSHWYDAARYACWICGIMDATGGIHIFANAHPSGKTVQFTYRGGVESMLEVVAPVDPTYGSVTFRASSVSKIGSLYYLCGRMTYNWNDGTATAFDCYLTSADCEHWSVGERSYYLHDADSGGALIVDTTPTPDVVYYGGNLVAIKATLTPAQSYNTADASQVLALTPLDFGLNQVSNAAHRLNATLENHGGALTGNALLKGGVKLYLTSGQAGTNAVIGTYDIDAPDTGVTAKGHSPARVTARDSGNKTLLRHNAPLDVDWWGQDATESALADLTDLILKTRKDDVLQLNTDDPQQPDLTLFDYTLGTEGLKSKALNNPLVVYADTAQSSAMLLHGRVTFPTGSESHALPVFSFILNATEDEFIGVAVAKDADWNAKTKPRVVISNLRAYSEAADSGGYLFEKRYQGLWESSNTAADAYLEALIEATSHYVTDTAFEAVAGTTYDFACRVSGRKVQFYKKVKDYAPTTLATSAAYVLTQEYAWDTDHLMTPDGRTRPGFAANTDVWASKAAFADAPVGDMTLQLTAAAESNVVMASDYTLSLGTASVSLLPTTTTTVTMATWSTLIVAGRWVRLIRVDGDGLFKVVTTNSGAKSFTINTAIGSTTVSITVKIPSVQAVYGTASSGYKKVTPTGANVWQEPGASKVDVPVKGRAAFIDESGSAISIRNVSTDGITHELYSGSTYVGGTGLAWDATNPLASGTYASGSEPSAWRMALTHGYLFDGLASALDMPDTGYVIIDQEAARYVPIRGVKRSSADETIWTGVAGYYAPVEAVESDADGWIVVKNWYNGATYPGDHFTDIPDSDGLLVEFANLESNSDRNAPDIQRYVNDAYTSGADYLLSFLPGYPHTLTAPSAGASSDLCIVSGRAQFGTLKAKHASDAAVCYYPVAIGGSALDSLVTVSAFNAYSGRYRSVEDALIYLSAFAGIRGATFRNYMTGASNTAAQAITITTSPQALDLVANMAGFVLIGTATLDATDYLQVNFRGYYKLAIRTPSAGLIEVGIQTTDTGVTAAADGYRWLEKVSVPVSNAAIGAVELRVAVVANRVTVEINGCPIWTFNLDMWTHTDGTSYKRTTAGAISISSSGTMDTTASTWRVPELWMPITQVALAQGSSTSQAIRQLCDKYYIKTRPTATGGILFSRFVVRDTADTATKHLQDHGQSSDDGAVRPHVQATGRVSGAYIDAAIVAAEGYSFEAVDNQDVATVGQATDAAHLEVREAVEYAGVDTLSGIARVAHEVEDVLPVEYIPAGTVGGDITEVWTNAGMPWIPRYDEAATPVTSNAPHLSLTSFVVSALDWKTVGGLLYAEYTLRNYKEWE